LAYDRKKPNPGTPRRRIQTSEIQGNKMSKEIRYHPNGLEIMEQLEWFPFKKLNAQEYNQFTSYINIMNEKMAHLSSEVYRLMKYNSEIYDAAEAIKLESSKYCKIDSAAIDESISDIDFIIAKTLVSLSSEIKKKINNLKETK
jgi:hypothetical protein